LAYANPSVLHVGRISKNLPEKEGSVTFFAISEDSYRGNEASYSDEEVAEMSNLTKVGVGLLALVLVAAFTFVIGSRMTNRSSESQPTIRLESDRLDTAMEEATRRIELGGSLGQAVAEGRKPLIEAARMYLAAHINQTGFLESNALHYPDRSPLEFSARNVALRAYQETRDPEKREQLARRLHEEFKATFPQAGPLHLALRPPVPGAELIPPPDYPPNLPFPPPLPTPAPTRPAVIAKPFPVPTLTQVPIPDSAKE
jgi:hypothetical protein